MTDIKNKISLYYQNRKPSIAVIVSSMIILLGLYLSYRNQISHIYLFEKIRDSQALLIQYNSLGKCVSSNNQSCLANYLLALEEKITALDFDHLEHGDNRIPNKLIEEYKITKENLKLLSKKK